MADSKQKLFGTYKAVELNLRKAGAKIFSDDSNLHTNQKLASKSMIIVMLQKMETEMLQDRYLELKSDLIKSERQTEIVDATVEALEHLFSENGLYVYAYVANMMIVLKRRVALGIEFVGNGNANKILDLYAEVSKTSYQKEFDNFRAAFKGLIDPGISICDFIYIKIHQHLSYHYRYQGPKQYGILMMAKYLNLRFQFGMYSKMENFLTEVLLLAVQAIEYELCMLKQARHLISFVYTHIKRIESKQEQTVNTDKLKLLKQLTIFTESLYLAVNLQKSYKNMMKKSEIGVFFDKYEKFKDDDIEEVNLPIRLARNQAELQTLYEQLCGYKSYVNEPVLSTIFDAIKVSVQTSSYFSKIMK